MLNTANNVKHKQSNNTESYVKNRILKTTSFQFVLGLTPINTKQVEYINRKNRMQVNYISSEIKTFKSSRQYVYTRDFDLSRYHFLQI